VKLEVLEVNKIKNEAHSICSAYEKLSEHHDIFFDLDYLLVNDRHEQGDTCLALLTDNEEILVSYAFVKRNFVSESLNFYDLITPYEYGGVLCFTGDNSDVIQFEELFNKYCQKNKIITDFQRVNPFVNELYENYPCKINISKQNQNIYVNLDQSEEMIFSNFHKNNRRDIRYALKNGVIIEKLKPSEGSIKVFNGIYKTTMDKKGASDFYYFNTDYFKALQTFSPDKMDIFVARNNNGIPISAALILKKGEFSHYHLSGTDRNYTKLCGNNLLLNEVILSMKEEGRKFFHLGGAAESQKGLYRFKQKFSKQTIPYYVVKKIFDENAYKHINEQIIGKRDLGEDFNQSDFFPLYRI